MFLSKDIMRLLIKEYFCNEVVYHFQLISKWTKSCITDEKLYQSQIARLAETSRIRQNKWLTQRRNNEIKRLVAKRFSKPENNIYNYYLKKEKNLIEELRQQEGDTRCWRCDYCSTPNKIKKHLEQCNL